MTAVATTPTQKDHIQEVWAMQLAQLDKIENPGLALIYVITALMPTVSTYTQACQEEQADLIDILQQVQNKISTIQTEFNSVERIVSDALDLSTVPDYSKITPHVDKAIQEAVDIMNLIYPPGYSSEDNPFSSIAGNIASDLNLLLGNDGFCRLENDKYVPIDKHNDNLERRWAQAWAPPTKEYGNKTLQPYTDAFSNMTNSVSGLNSSTGTELQFWQGSDQQIHSLIEQLMQSLLSLHSTVVNNFRS